ncbi:MAG: hypothetical protein KAG97_13365, partial [Victivallales bacterium]|nr:hypothetical protein [Victivallales bacterium]
DPALAMDVVSHFFDNQSIEGNIPATARPFSVSGSAAGAHLYQAVWNIETRGGIRSLQGTFDRMERFEDWQAVHRKSVEGLYIHGSASEFRNDPATAELRHANPGASGMSEEVRSVAYNSLVTYRKLLMAKFANYVGKESAAQKYDDETRQLSERIHETTWDEENGFYCDLIGEAPVRDIALSGFLTLIAEIPTRKQASRMLQWLPVISDRISLLGSYPETAPLFGMVATGLRKYGFFKEASESALALSEYALRLDSRERYRMPRVAATLTLVQNVIGFHKYRGRYLLCPGIPEKWAEKPIVIYDGEFDYTTTLTLGEEGVVECSVTDAKGVLFRKLIKNHEYCNVPVPIAPNNTEADPG